MSRALVVDIKAMRAQVKVIETQTKTGAAPGSDFGETVGRVAGVEVWRIEKLKVVPVAKAQHGKFYSGDSYIVLHTRQRGTALVWDLYFWLGKETSQDEAAVAAYKTVELDNLLGGAPTQFRETQGDESAGFRAVFSSLRYLAGGVESALRSAADASRPPEPRLLHCKGAKTVVVTEVALACSSLNHGDVFVLDACAVVYQWNGHEANRREKARALEVSLSIRDDDRKGKAALVLIDEPAPPPAGSPAPAADEDTRAFFKLLAGSAAQIRSAADAGADDAVGGAAARGVPSAPAAAPKLLRISDAKGGTLVTTPVGVPGALLLRALLDDDDAFLLDAAGGGGGGGGSGGGVYVWIGKRASPAERSSAVRVADKYARGAGRGSSVQISRVASGGEPASFRAHFVDWEAPRAGPATDVDAFRRAQARTAGPVAAESTEQLAARLGSARSAPPRAVSGEGAPLGAPPRAGALSVWRIEAFEKRLLPPAEHGLFNADDCYIMQHVEQAACGKETVTLYYWIGSQASQDEKGAAAILTVQLSDARGGGCAQVRICQGHESARFLSLFAPRFLVLAAGGVASGFRAREAKPPAEPPADKAGGGSGVLIHVRGSCAQDVHGVQLREPRAAALSSYDAFVVQSPIAAAGAGGGGGAVPAWMAGALSAAAAATPTVWVWAGSAANAAEREGATAIAELLVAATARGENPNVLGGAAGKDSAVSGVCVVQVAEGSEPAALWEALGGKADYTRATAAGGKGGGGGGLFGGLFGNSAYAQRYTPDDARLFAVSDRTGALKVEEILNWAQDDLNPDDVFIVDAGSVLYVWIGSAASERERAGAPELADKFAAKSAAGSGRAAQLPVIRIEAGREPDAFKALFHGWSDDKVAGGYDPYEAKLKSTSGVRRAAPPAKS